MCVDRGKAEVAFRRDGITVTIFLAIPKFSERIEKESLPIGIGELRDASIPLQGKSSLDSFPSSRVTRFLGRKSEIFRM
jgi:hypothetical protein